MSYTGATEIIPEHVHHNYKHTDAYTKSKASRNTKAAVTGQFGKAGEYSNEHYW